MTGRHLHLNTMFRIQTDGHADVRSNLFGRESFEVIFVHPGEEVVDKVVADIGRKGLNPSLEFHVEHNSCYRATLSEDEG